MASQDNCSYKEMELDIPGHPRKLPQSSRLTRLSQLASSEDRRCLQHKINKQNIFLIFLLLNEDAADKNQLCFISLQLFP